MVAFDAGLQFLLLGKNSRSKKTQKKAFREIYARFMLREKN
jgi:hypothetical protein